MGLKRVEMFSVNAVQVSGTVESNEDVVLAHDAAEEVERAPGVDVSGIFNGNGKSYFFLGLNTGIYSSSVCVGWGSYVSFFVSTPESSEEGIVPVLQEQVFGNVEGP